MTRKQIEAKQAKRKAKRTAKKRHKENIIGFIGGGIFGLIMVAIFYFTTC